MIMSLKQRKIKFEPRIKLNHNIYKLHNLRLHKKYKAVQIVKKLNSISRGTV